jgi:hypothetical protein
MTLLKLERRKMVKGEFDLLKEVDAFKRAMNLRVEKIIVRKWSARGNFTI